MYGAKYVSLYVEEVTPMFQRGGDKKSKRMDLARTSEALQAKYPIAMIFLVKVRFGPRFQGCPLGNKSGHPLEMKRFNNRRKYDSESSSSMWIF
ncbi:hypothetical protein GN244_ATG16991 [Phytophthora infestans]|uniref:Uncharacterized protein n=1 Tax=Phytophthora infestans TaxID=4787 RepID=A0A833SHW2_PHYIN|nr:hypothetical protein GN244_ATG16991 [Phytophthora infestans]